MSAKIMGQVFECDLPHNKAWVLMAYADHADHDGRNCFPRVALVAWKTGYDIRSLRRIVKELRKDGIMIETGQTAFGVKIYRIELSHIPRKAPFVEIKAGRPKGSFDKAPRGEQPGEEPGYVDFDFDDEEMGCQKNPCQIDTPLSVTHNHQLPITKSNSTSIANRDLCTDRQSQDSVFGLFDESWSTSHTENSEPKS